MGKVKYVVLDFIKILKINFSYFLIAVISVTAFFMHESFVYEYDVIEEAKIPWQEDKKQRTIALEKVKKLSIGTPEYDEYWKWKVKTDESYSNLLGVTEDAKFLGFKNKQQWLGEFGPYFGILVVFIFLLIKFWFKKSKTLIGEVFLCGTFICISLFYLRWTFNRVDYLDSTYVYANIISTLLIVISTYCFVKYKEKVVKRRNEIAKESEEFINLSKDFFKEINESLVKQL